MRSERPPCECGCGGTPKGARARFLPGHDTRVHAAAGEKSGVIAGTTTRKAARLCLCGCGETTKGGRFRPGHDRRVHTAAHAVAAATGVPSQLLRYAGLAADLPEARTRLEVIAGRVKGKTLGAETNTLRWPVWSPTKHDTPLQLRLSWEHHGETRRLVVDEPAGAMTVRDLVLLTWVSTAYIAAGAHPDDLVAELPGYRELARRLGYEAEGGWGKAAVQESLRRLRALSIVTTLRVPDPARPGHVVEFEEELTLLQNRRSYSRGPEGRLFIALTNKFAALLRSGTVTFLRSETLEALLRTNELAARLWLFLEAETLRPDGLGFWYRFASAVPPAEGQVALTDLLRLTDSNARRNRAKVAKAAATVARLDERYRFVVEGKRGRQGLRVWRSNLLESGPSAVRSEVEAWAVGGTGAGRQRYGSGPSAVRPERGTVVSSSFRPSCSRSVRASPGRTREPGNRNADDGTSAEKKTTTLEGGTPGSDTAKRLPRKQTRDTVDEWSFHSYMDDVLREKGERPAGWVHPDDRRAASSGSPTEPRSDPGEPGVPPVPAPGVLRGAPVSGEPREQEEP